MKNNKFENTRTMNYENLQKRTVFFGHGIKIKSVDLEITYETFAVENKKVPRNRNCQ